RPELMGKTRGEVLLDQLGIDRFWKGRHPDERALAAVHGGLTVRPKGHTGEIAVRFGSADPELAAQFVNRLVERYLASEAAGSTLGSGAVRVAAWAEIPDRPEALRKGPVAMLGMVVMLLAGLGA